MCGFYKLLSYCLTERARLFYSSISSVYVLHTVIGIRFQYVKRYLYTTELGSFCRRRHEFLRSVDIMCVSCYITGLLLYCRMTAMTKNNSTRLKFEGFRFTYLNGYNNNTYHYNHVFMVRLIYPSWAALHLCNNPMSRVYGESFRDHGHQVFGRKNTGIWNVFIFLRSSYLIKPIRVYYNFFVSFHANSRVFCG